MNNNTLNKLKSDYEELEIKPSSDLWDRLDEKLDEAAEISLKPSFQWWKYAAVVLLLISVGTVIYFVNKDKFDDQEADFIVKKRLENTVNPINPEFENQPINSKEEKIEKSEVKVVAENQKSGSDINLKTEKKIIQSQVSELKTQKVAIKQPENINIQSSKIEIQAPNIPLIAEVKKTKSTYINAEELLLGREFDKTREEAKKDEKKFGVFNVNKVFKKVENVTVLGVTVYSEPK